MASDKNTPATTAKAPKSGLAETEHEIPLSQIRVRWDWNARAIKAEALADVGSADEHGKGSTGISGLADSITDDGQDTPVVLRPNPDHDPKNPASPPYDLVCGFRRTKAVMMIASRGLASKVDHPIGKYPKWSASKPTIRAVVRTMTETEARLANMRENTARDDISGADLCVAVTALYNDYKVENGGEDRGAKAAIARGLSKNESYIGKLVEIGEGVPADCLGHWRSGATKPLSITAMYQVLVAEPARRAEEYQRLCNAGRGPVANGTEPAADGSDPLAWLAGVKAKAEEIGYLFGLTEALSEMPANTCNGIVWANILVDGGATDPGLLKVKKGADAASTAAIVESVEAGVKRGFLTVKNAAGLAKEAEDKKAAKAKEIAVNAAKKEAAAKEKADNAAKKEAAAKAKAEAAAKKKAETEAAAAATANPTAPATPGAKKKGNGAPATAAS